MTAIATANLPARKMTDDELTTGLEAVLAPRPRYVVLQEVGPDRHQLLVDVAKRHGYKVVRAKGGPPVLYRSAVTSPLRIRAVRLSRPAYVGQLTGRKSKLPASIATEVLFEDDELGEVVVIDAHLDAEVQTAGGYRTDKAHQPRVRRHQRQCRRLEGRAERHLAKGRRVFIGLDGNFDGLQLPPLTSCWAGRDGQGTLEGPHGGLSDRAVDIVFGPPARSVDRIVTGSDHRAVIVTY